MVVVPQQSDIQRIQLLSNQMMQGHAGVLRRALNQPIQCVPFLNLKPLINHGLCGLSAAAVAEFRASRGEMGPAQFAAALEEVWMEPEPAQAETECLVEPMARSPVLELKLAIVLKAPA